MSPSKSTLKRFKELPCARCGVSTGESTVDHIIPKQLLKCIGITDTSIENYQPLCQKCNKTKGALLDPINEKTWELLDKYITRWKNLHRKSAPRRTYAFRNIEVQSDRAETVFGV